MKLWYYFQHQNSLATCFRVVTHQLRSVLLHTHLTHNMFLMFWFHDWF